MIKKEPNSIQVVREERFVERDSNAFVVLSKEDSDRIIEQARLAKEARKAKRMARRDESPIPIHFPVYTPVRGTDEFPLVNVNEEMTDCLPLFTSRELAELYLSEAGSELELHKIDEQGELANFVRGMVTNHALTYYAINFTFNATGVVCGPVSDLLGS